MCGVDVDVDVGKVLKMWSGCGRVCDIAML